MESVESPGELDAAAGESVVKLLLEVDVLAEALPKMFVRSKSAHLRQLSGQVSVLSQALRLGIALEQRADELLGTTRQLVQATTDLKLYSDKARLDATARGAIIVLETLSKRLCAKAEVWALSRAGEGA